MDKTVRLTLNNYARNGVIRDCGSKATLIQNGEEVLKFPEVILLQDSTSKFCERTFWIVNLLRVHEGDYDDQNSNSKQLQQQQKQQQ